MASLAGSTIASTYTYLLKMDATSGITSSLVKVQDGDGTQSALSIGTTKVGIDAGDEFYFDTDTGAHTYITEGSGDALDFYVGGQLMCVMDEDTDIVHFQCATVSFDNTDSDSPYIQVKSDPDNDLHHLQLAGTGHGTDTLRIGRSDGGVLEIDGASVLISAPMNIGVDDTGYDVKFYGAASGRYMLWDESRGDLILSAGSQLGVGTTTPSAEIDITTTGADAHLRVTSTDNDAVLTVKSGDSGDNSFIYLSNVNDDGQGTIYYDHNATETSQSLRFKVGDNADNTAMTIIGDGKIGMGTTGPDCTLHIAGALAASGPSETHAVFADVDATPDVSAANMFYSGSATETIENFDGGVKGQVIYIASQAAITFSHDAGNIRCGSHDLVTASGDVTAWIKWTNWTLISWYDSSANLASSSVGF